MLKDITFGGTLAWLKEAASPSHKKANYIRARTIADRQVVLLQVHIAGEPGSWVEYNADQLDELIRMLQTHRSRR
jgi:hypothetical protein